MWRSIAFVWVCVCLNANPRVELKRVPDGGIQPQVAADADGTLHLVYYQGDPAGGDLIYRRSTDGGSTFSAALRVNSVPGSAVAIGNIRGARLAVGGKGQVHVAWNGSQNAARGNSGRAPMLYARLNAAGTAFEPERNLIQLAYGVDGGGGVAADRDGRVYVFWHAPMPGKEGEEFRRVWMARSQDSGKTFEPERIAWNEPTGACGCCSLDAFADGQGAVHVLFRAAHEAVHRDMYLLVSKDHGNTFSGSDVSKWDVGYCVMSSESFIQAPDGAVLAAWETEKQVHFGRLAASGLELRESVLGNVGKNRKYPSLAVNSLGNTLLAWTEGMGWKRGGSLQWQLFDKSGKPIDSPGQAEGVPVWSVVAAFARPDGTFVLFY